MPKERFEDIRPYEDSEINDAMCRITEDPAFDRLGAMFFPDMPRNELKSLIRKVTRAIDFQKNVMYPVFIQLLNKSTDEYIFKDLNPIKSSLSYVFISNHRDIVLDALLMQKSLLDNNLDTTEVTFGSNLMSNSFIIDIGKSNKMFKVIRDASPREFLKNSRLLSAYIRYTVTSKHQSIWIAQRNGRTKDGKDKTDQGLIKMLAFSGSREFEHNLTELNITPVSVSYEYEPCDFLKVRELYLSERGPYRKSKQEDLESIVTGITQYKGKVQLVISKSIDVEELKYIDSLKANIKFDALAKVIDRRIIENYKLWKTNYIAFDLIDGSSRYSSEYDNKERENFIEYVDSQISKIKDVTDQVELRRLFLNLYANPVISYQDLIK